MPLKVLEDSSPSPAKPTLKVLQKASQPHQDPAEQHQPADRLPYAPEIEKAVLAVMLQFPDSIANLSRSINQFYFFAPTHRTIYQTLCDLNESGNVGLLQLTETLREKRQLEKVGGAGFVTDLQTMTAVPEALEWYSETLRDKYSRREMIRVGSNMMRAAHGEDNEVVDLVSSFSFSLDRIRNDFNHQNGTLHFEFDELMEFDTKSDPDCLVGNRYLVRGGSALWAAGSGYGKSTLALQLAVYWACGQPCFGLRPVRPLKSLIIQAENDLGDMGEQLQGVIAGVSAIGDIDVEASRQKIETNIGIYRAIGKTGVAFLDLLDTLLEVDRPDLAWIDPLFAFAGCDLLDPKETSHFLRNGLFPMAHNRRVAMNVIHHVSKPVKSDTKKGAPVADIDLQYLGFGTSEIQNAFRVVNILIPVNEHPGSFKLALSKRGERSGVGRSLYLQQSDNGTICWTQIEPPQKAKSAKYQDEDILEEMSVMTGWDATALQAHMKTECGMGHGTFYRIWKSLKRGGKIRLDANEKWIKNA